MLTVNPIKKELEVAKMNRQSSEEKAKALLIQKEAEAKSNELLVKAGLTPKEKAEIERDTKIGVARELAKVNVPSIVVSGDKNGNVSPMDAIGVNMLLDINNKISGKGVK